MVKYNVSSHVIIKQFYSEYHHLSLIQDRWEFYKSFPSYAITWKAFEIRLRI